MHQTDRMDREQGLRQAGCECVLAPTVERPVIARRVTPRSGPVTYSVTMYGVSASGSASRICTTHAPDTRRAAVTSRRKRARNPSSSASSARTTLTATWRLIPVASGGASPR